ncbi:MAG: hypothetical protein HYV63_05185 [Candidatus Schekmanbacteria bacterium]|nr:hypothetical protein [Candidatus Schekmanbacteria bacterium]
MIHAYAIEPDCVVAWCDRRSFRLVFGRFGVGTPRLLLELPKFSSWRKAVFDAASKVSLSDLDRTRLTELFKLLGDQRVRRVGTSYDGTRPWLDNAEAEYARHPFAAIIAMANPRSHAAVLLEAAVGDESNPLWHRPLAATPPRTPEGIAAVVSALVENCDELHLVDPHFGPENSRHRKVLEHLVTVVASRPSGQPKDICVHCSGDNGVSLAFFEQQAAQMSSHIAAGVRIRFKRWSERRNGEKLHNRYLLTDIGGVIFGVGLDEGKASQTDDVNLMDAVQFLKRWGQFNDTCAFDLVDEPKAVVGVKR